MMLEESVNNVPSLYAVGGGHNVGKYGLPNLLANEGYTLTPLIKGVPEAKSRIVKKLACGYTGQGFFNMQFQTAKEKNKITPYVNHQIKK